MSITVRTATTLVLLALFAAWALPCTSFVLANKEQGLFGTNLDHANWAGFIYVNMRSYRKAGWEPSGAGEFATWVSKYGSVTFNLVGYQLPWAGMNETGLVISTMGLRATSVAKPDERPPLVSCLWMQYILDTCATVDEVIASDKRFRISKCEDHYLVRDGTGDCAVIELLKGKMVCHRGDSFPVHALANTGYASSVEQWKEGIPSDSHPNNSIARFGRAADRLQSYDIDASGSAIDYAFDILESVSSQTTRWRIVFDTQERSIYFRTNRIPRIRHIQMAKLDFSSSEKVKMMDVHADLAGDVTRAFEGYSHERSLDHSIVYAKRCGSDFTEEMIKGLYRHLEGFSPDSSDADAPDRNEGGSR